MELTKEQIKVLEGIGNRSANHASKSLSQLINKNVKVEMKIVDIKSIVDVKPVKVVSPDSYVLLEILGDIPGYFLMLSSKATTFMLLDFIKDREIGTTKGLVRADKDALGEIGNIITGSFLSVLSDVSGLSVRASIPTVATNFNSAVVHKLIKSLNPKISSVFVIDALLYIEKLTFTEEIMFILTENSLAALIEALGGKT